MTMEPYQLRVIEERDVLYDKCEALYVFLASKYFETLDPKSQQLLKDQYYVMKVYLSILNQRIELF